MEKLPRKEDLLPKSEPRKPQSGTKDREGIPAPTTAQNIDADIAEKEARIRQIDVDRRLAEAEGTRDKPEVLAKREADLAKREERFLSDKEGLMQRAEVLRTKEARLATEREEWDATNRAQQEQAERLAQTQREQESQFQRREKSLQSLLAHAEAAKPIVDMAKGLTKAVSQLEISLDDVGDILDRNERKLSEHNYRVLCGCIDEAISLCSAIRDLLKKKEIKNT